MFKNIKAVNFYEQKLIYIFSIYTLSFEGGVAEFKLFCYWTHVLNANLLNLIFRNDNNDNSTKKVNKHKTSMFVHGCRIRK